MDKVAFKFDPFELMGIDPPKGKRSEIKAALKDYILDAVLEYTSTGKSPVAGGAWKRSLSKEYRDRKVAQGGKGFADMELTHSMMDQLEVVNAGSGLEIRIKGKEAAKADGHNNHSGDSKLPPREFIPREDGTFKRPIVDGMKAIAREFMDDDE